MAGDLFESAPPGGSIDPRLPQTAAGEDRDAHADDMLVSDASPVGLQKAADSRARTRRGSFPFVGAA